MRLESLNLTQISQLGPIPTQPGGNLIGSRGIAKSANPTDIKEAAATFEGFLIAQMLRSAREASQASLGDTADEHDSETGTILELAEQNLAVGISKGGGLGIAKLVLKGLEHPSETPEAAGQLMRLPVGP